MNYLYSVVIAVCFLGMCSTKVSSAQMTNQTLEYQLDGGQHAVVVVIDQISEKEAREIAKRKAAEITVAQGDRYFTIDSEEKTEVIKSQDMPENQRFYNNMYQELIIEGDFNRERLSRESYPNTNIYPAIRITFTPYLKKPSRNAIDACTLTNCK